MPVILQSLANQSPLISTRRLVRARKEPDAATAPFQKLDQLLRDSRSLLWCSEFSARYATTTPSASITQESNTPINLTSPQRLDVHFS